MKEGVPKLPTGEKEEANLDKDPHNIVYERPVLEREHGREAVESLKEDFSSFYNAHGYEEHEPVLISSGIDPTVRFVGSHISVFKPYLLSDTVPTNIFLDGAHFLQA